jgi:hypothetical protein
MVARLNIEHFRRLLQSETDESKRKMTGRMDRMVARLNIEHFRRLLQSETDESKRKMLLRLIDEEEEKLATADLRAAAKPPEKTKGRPAHFPSTLANE